MRISAQPHIPCCSLCSGTSIRSHNHGGELASKVTLLRNELLRKSRGLKRILLFCQAQHAMETFTSPFLLKLAGRHVRATSNWDVLQGREIPTRLRGYFCNLLFLRKSLFFSTSSTAHPAFIRSTTNPCSTQMVVISHCSQKE